MRAYQRLLRDLLEPSDWQTHDKHGNALDEPFLKKSGWRKIARAFNLSFERVHSHGRAPARRQPGARRCVDPGDRPQRPVRRRGRLLLGGRGALQELEGTSEGRERSARYRDYAREEGAFGPRRDGEVSAEEIAPGGEHEGLEPALAAGARASDELRRVAFAALASLLGNGDADQGAARRVGERITGEYGYLPVAVGRALCYAAGARGAKQPGNEKPAPTVRAVAEDDESASETPADLPASEVLAYWQRKGGYSDKTLLSLAGLVCGEGELESLSSQELGELAFLVECAVRGKVARRSLDGWLSQLSDAEDRAAAVKVLRARLIEKANEVELVGRRKAA